MDDGNTNKPQTENQLSSSLDISTSEALHVFGKHMDHPSPKLGQCVRLKR